jgi:outer membrane protein W
VHKWFYFSLKKRFADSREIPLACSFQTECINQTLDNMKKKILLVTMLGAACIAASAQTLTVGPKAGINVSTLTNLEDLKPKAGFTAGGFLVYSFIENFGVGLDVLYSKEGAKYRYEISDGSNMVKYQYKADLNYLRLNVPLTYFFCKKENSLRPKIYAGPSLAFLLSAKNKSEVISASGNDVSAEEGTTTVTDNYKGTDFGALAGAGFNYKLAEATWLNFDASYHIGATDIPKDPEEGSDAVKNTGFAFTVGVGFGF